MILLIHLLHQLFLSFLIPASPVEARAQLHCREMVVKLMIMCVVYYYYKNVFGNYYWFVFLFGPLVNPSSQLISARNNIKTN